MEHPAEPKPSRRRAILVAGGLLALLPIASLTLAADDAERGRAIATEFCSGCHAIGARGRSPNRLSPPFRTIGQRYPIDDLEETFAEGTSGSHRGMPDLRFSPAATMDLLAYMKSVQPRTRAR